MGSKVLYIVIRGRDKSSRLVWIVSEAMRGGNEFDDGCDEGRAVHKIDQVRSKLYSSGSTAAEIHTYHGANHAKKNQKVLITTGKFNHHQSQFRTQPRNHCWLPRHCCWPGRGQKGEGRAPHEGPQRRQNVPN